MMVGESDTERVQRTNDETDIIGQQRDEQSAAPSSVGRWCSIVTHG